MDHDDTSERDPLGWVTDFDNPEVAKPRDKASASGLERLVTRVVKSKPFLIVCAASFAAAAAVVVVVVLSSSVPNDARTDSMDVDDAVPLALPTSSPSPTATALASSLLPEDCDDVYSADMKGRLAQAGLEVNSAWTGSRSLPAGTADRELLSLLAGEDTLGCYWLDSNGGEDEALLTVLAASPEPKTELAMNRLTELGLTRREEHGGVRFYGESRSATGEVSGESHFFREGLWFATVWYGIRQFGYSADMATTVFG